MTADYTDLDKPTRYSKLLIFQYQKEKAIKTINLFGLVILQLIEIYKKMIDAFDIETAQGKQLDLIGQIIGLERLLYNGIYVNDETYRFFLKLQIILNYQLNTTYSIQNSLYNYFQDKIVYINNRNMTAQYIFFEFLNNEIINILVQNKNILPVPAGVNVSYIIKIEDKKIFGYYIAKTDTIADFISGYTRADGDWNKATYLSKNNFIA